MQQAAEGRTAGRLRRNGLQSDLFRVFFYMQENLFRAKSFKESFLPNGLASDLQEETRRYDQVIAEHPIDFQILGIGHNGHIGFNEPNDEFDKNTHCVNLTENTIQANSRFFASIDEVPKQAITMGIGAIMKAKCVLLVASGEAKAPVMYDAFFGPVTPHVPASILQFHPNLIVVADEAALKIVSEKCPEALA